MISVPRRRWHLAWLLGSASLASTLGEPAGTVRLVAAPTPLQLRMNQVGGPLHGPKWGMATTSEPLPEQCEVLEAETGRWHDAADGCPQGLGRYAREPTRADDLEWRAVELYHDDFQDYATNEPTTDGTASALLRLSLP